MLKTFENGVLTVTRDDGAVLTLSKHPSRYNEWRSEREALDFSITSNYGFTDVVQQASEAGERVRQERDELLQETDYLALTDLVLSDEVRAYRQDLRVVPQQEGFPDSVAWPTKP